MELIRRHGPDITVMCIAESFVEVGPDLLDGIDDNWEKGHFNGDLLITNAESDFDEDNYTDLQEYLNYSNGELDPDGNSYHPEVTNAPAGTGYENSVTGALPVLLQFLLLDD